MNAYRPVMNYLLNEDKPELEMHFGELPGAANMMPSFAAVNL